LQQLGHWLAAFFDPRIVDGAVNGVGWLTTTVGRYLTRLQTGSIRHYALGLLLGAVVIVGYFVLV
jgi:NADH-quinone oxidoreductase subunit L